MSFKIHGLSLRGARQMKIQITSLRGIPEVSGEHDEKVRLLDETNALSVDALARVWR
jgi:hypothetical protein